MPSQKRKIVFGILIGLLLANSFAWASVYDSSQNKFLEVNFFDVGQGDAILTEWTQYIPSYSGLNSLI